MCILKRVQGQCKPNAESSLFAEAKPVLAALFRKALQRYCFLATQPNKMHKIDLNVHRLILLCNLFETNLIIIKNVDVLFSKKIVWFTKKYISLQPISNRRCYG